MQTSVVKRMSSKQTHPTSASTAISASGVNPDIRALSEPLPLRLARSSQHHQSYVQLTASSAQSQLWQRLRASISCLPDHGNHRH